MSKHKYRQTNTLKVELLTYDDVLIAPRFSKIKSRKDVDLSVKLGRLDLKLPILNAPMDTVATTQLVNVLLKKEAGGVLHRFQSVDENIKQFLATGSNVIVSVGMDDLDRASSLYNAGARNFLLDVAHGAQITVVEWVNRFKEVFNDTFLMVGNFATGQQIDEFNTRLGRDIKVDAYRVGVGPGSACSTRINTGCGLPVLESILDCRDFTDVPIIADGGIKSPGDVAKALAAGASAVMLGGMFAGTDETGTLHFRGSASRESYLVQNKNKEYITEEGASMQVKAKGSVEHVLNHLEGGLRSAFTYVGASNLKDFYEKATLHRISNSSLTESYPHGLKNW